MKNRAKRKKKNMNRRIEVACINDSKHGEYVKYYEYWTSPTLDKEN